VARTNLSLEVKPTRGGEYMTRLTWLVEVSRMFLLQQGQILSVKINQQDQKIIYPYGDWAKYIPE
jgi:hypothetical protein